MRIRVNAEDSITLHGLTLNQIVKVCDLFDDVVIEGSNKQAVLHISKALWRKQQEKEGE